MIFLMSYLQKWLPKIDNVKPLLQTGILIGTGYGFLCQKFRFVRQVQYYCCNYRKFIQEVTCTSCEDTIVAMEMLKNVLKLQGGP